MAGNCGQQQHLSVPPGFRFHPTEEELLYYYLRKKVSYEPIDLDVIREVDLNKLEPWDLNDKCGIGSGPQNEWYFFSHKDKKYPTGTRTNRATMAGFWKATGRDKAIHLTNSKRIGMRKTLVFYTGRAPHGHKSDWIMHEYRLDEDNAEIQEDGWVVCRAFKKKNHTRINNFHPDIDHEDPIIHGFGDRTLMEPKQNSDDDQATYNNSFHHTNATLLTCPVSKILPSFSSSSSLPLMDVQRSQSLLRLSAGGPGIMHVGKFSGNWSFLEKLWATNQNQFPVSHVSDLVAAQERMFSFP